MKKFLLLALTSVMLSNSATAMNQVPGLQVDRIKVTRNPFNLEAWFLNLGGAAGVVASVVEGSVSTFALSALAVMIAYKLDKEKCVRIQIYKGDTLIEDSYTRGTFDAEKLINEKELHILECMRRSAWVQPQTPYRSPFGGNDSESVTQND